MSVPTWLSEKGREKAVKKAVTIKENHEFRRLYSRGKSAVGPAMVLYCRKNRLGASRLGLTASTKLGRAVVRNRARRRLREVYRLSLPRLRPGYDLVIVARARCLTAPFPQLMAGFERQCRSLGIWREGP